jgi:hypothetical protein
MIRPIRLISTLAAVLAASAACSDPNALANSAIENALDTNVIYSLATGPLTQPVAYSVNARGAVRIYDVGTNFEFAFSMDSSGKAVFLPLDVLNLAGGSSLKPGLLKSTTSFDAMTKAPQNGYVTSDTIAVAEGERYFIRTGINTCSSLGVPLYAKLEILDLDTASQTVKMQVVANENCGYRSLKLGLPKS